MVHVQHNSLHVACRRDSHSAHVSCRMHYIITYDCSAPFSAHRSKCRRPTCNLAILGNLIFSSATPSGDARAKRGLLSIPPSSLRVRLSERYCSAQTHGALLHSSFRRDHVVANVGTSGDTLTEVRGPKLHPRRCQEPPNPASSLGTPAFLDRPGSAFFCIITTEKWP